MTKTIKINIAAIPIFKRQMCSSRTDDVIFSSMNRAGIVTINRPPMNILNYQVFTKLLPQLQEWEQTKKLVVLKGHGGRAFSAGGDVKALTVLATDDTTSLCKVVATNFRIDHLIANYKIPCIALINGLALGGGMALAMHSRYRVATEKSQVAMPESKIGYFPDSGASYFLPRLPANLGIYLGLTGNSLSGHDILKAGVATHYISSKQLPIVERLLINCENDRQVQDLLGKFNENIGQFSLAAHIKDLNYCFGANTVEEILQRLKRVGSTWSSQTLQTLLQISPTILKVCLRQCQLGANLNLGQCLQMELRLAARVCSHRDFHEGPVHLRSKGVRALLFDKDKTPKWHPATLKDVDDNWIDTFFKELTCDQELFLKSLTKH